MLRSLYITLVFLSFLVLGTAAPFVFSLGYVWVDTFRPQDVSYSLISGLPVSAIMGAAAVASYLAFDRRHPAPFSMHTALTVLLAAWVTVTTMFFAVSPSSAWTKWDWAIKTILFSAFIPLVIRSFVQIEAFLQVYVFSLAIHILPPGLKTMVSGGGYGKSLNLVEGNTGFAEGSTLAAVSILIVPLILYFRKQTVLFPRGRSFDLLYLGLATACLACAVGTYARTAFIGLIVLGVSLWLRARRKILGAVLGAIVAAALTLLTSQAWEDRISTINDYQTENSALGRILVWKWTLRFVGDHPMGGGFNSFEVNGLNGPLSQSGEGLPGSPGKAFHSIYFEVLGEHGWPGVALYGGMILVSFFSLQRTSRRARGCPELERCRDLAHALQVSLVTLLACGAFIGVAFQPMFFYLCAISACLANYARRVQEQLGTVSVSKDWRAQRLTWAAQRGLSKAPRRSTSGHAS